jgi:hypothetical protein
MRNLIDSLFGYLVGSSFESDIFAETHPKTFFNPREKFLIFKRLEYFEPVKIAQDIVGGSIS